MDTTPYISLFLQECRDNCAQISQLLLSLEKDGPSEKSLSQIMRFSHSCKGACAMMRFEKMASCFHQLEDLFMAAKNGKEEISSDQIDRLLQTVDMLEAALKTVETEGHEPVDLSVTSILEGETPLKTVAKETAEETSLELPHIRVDSRTLDTLLDLSGELSLLSQQFRTLADSVNEQPETKLLVDRLEKNMQELTFHISQSRLVPLDQAFARFPRLVRDLAKTQKKNIRFEMKGTDIRLDKSIIDHLTSPVIHLLRNAVDHGIESPEERKKIGKPEEGRITLTVRRDAGAVVISVEDDGQAIELFSVRETAKKRGFSEKDIANITEDSLLDLLCSERFSSSESVSMVSGRGVGLSAVKSDVLRLGGKLTLERSAASKGFELTLPLSLSIIQVIFVQANNTIYGIPFLHVERLLHVATTDLTRTMGGTTLDFHGNPLPLASLSSLLDNTSTAAEAIECKILVVRDGQTQMGLIVDSIHDAKEVMVKPVAQAIKAANLYSGCCLLGDGSVALLLDVAALLQHSMSVPRN